MRVAKSLYFHGGAIYHDLQHMVVNLYNGDFRATGYHLGDLLNIFFDTKYDSLTTVKDLELFVKGLGKGVLGGDFGDFNVSACIRDAPHFLEKIKAQFHQICFTDMNKTAQAIMNIVQIIQNDLQDCKKIGGDLNKLVSIILTLNDPVTVVYGIVKILLDPLHSFGLIKNSINSMKKGEYESSGINLGKFIGLLLGTR